jgi:succinyl-CoA synthetase beta subunit
MKNARSYNAGAQITGVLCSKMVKNPVAEAIVGVMRDPAFGPAVVFGLGGVLVEVLRDRAIAIPPLTREEARAMIDATKGRALLYGYRGAPRADVEALIDVIVRTGDMTADLSERIDELDINPLLILEEGKGVVAVDALLSIKKES